MSNTLYILFVMACLAIAGLAVPGPLRERFRGSNDNTDISIAENKEMIRFMASYPRRKAQNVHAYIKRYFNLGDLTNMSGVEINQYLTPDSSMSFSILSRDGYVQIEMDRLTNSQAAIDRVRQAAGGLKIVLEGKSD
jgi:hypothetical protein